MASCTSVADGGEGGRNTGALETVSTIATASAGPETALPKVSVIIPVKDDAERLAICLQSLREQDYPANRLEILVIDNGSKDGSAEVALQHGARVCRFPGLRVGALRNRGVERASGEVLAFVDSDHEAPPGWIRRGVLQLRAQGAACIVGSPCLAPPRGSWVQWGWEQHRLRQPGTRQVPWLGAGNMFMRRSDFESLGGFREDLVAAEDVDLCVRFARRSGRMISDLQLANVHHGEPRTLWQFFWKEYWRGSSGVLGFLSHGMPWHELPSLVYPAYHLLAGLLLVGAACVAAWQRSPLWLAVTAFAAIFPSLLLAVTTSWQARRLSAFLPLVILYLTYGFSRAAALFKR